MTELPPIECMICKEIAQKMKFDDTMPFTMVIRGISDSLHLHGAIPALLQNTLPFRDGKLCLYHWIEKLSQRQDRSKGLSIEVDKLEDRVKTLESPKTTVVKEVVKRALQREVAPDKLLPPESHEEDG